MYTVSSTQKEKLLAALNIAALCLTKNPLIPLCMGFFILLVGITKLDWERNQFIMEKLGVQSIILEIQQNHRKWLQHLY